MRNRLIKLCGRLLPFSFTVASLFSCSHNVSTPDDCKYLSAFQRQYEGIRAEPLYKDSLALYVDYSTCMAMGQNSGFFNALVPSFVDATKKYYSLKGSTIAEEQGSTFELLRTITEVNYADLKSAIDRMASGNGESVLLTDGEFYQQNIAKGNINNPYMAGAFKKWLLRGHDIYIISEPYTEYSGGRPYNKKRFYVLFTDTRLSGNIYDRIMQTTQLQKFPSVQIFHLAANHPALFSGNGRHSQVNPLIEAKVEGFGNYEIQDWQLDWKNGIEPLIVNAVDPRTGNPQPDGDYILKDLRVDRNSLGAFRIAEIEARVFNINAAYADFYDAQTAGTPPSKTLAIDEVSNFIKLDNKEFSKHGEVSLHFDTQMYDPTCLNGTPYNYLKVDLYVSKIVPIFEQFADMFKFDSIDVPGEVNVSVATSIQQCMADPEIQQKVMEQPFYSIYLKTLER